MNKQEEKRLVNAASILNKYCFDRHRRFLDHACKGCHFRDPLVGCVLNGNPCIWGAWLEGSEKNR